MSNDQSAAAAPVRDAVKVDESTVRASPRSSPSPPPPPPRKRVKQTARKTCGGQAPRRSLNTRAAQKEPVPEPSSTVSSDNKTHPNPAESDSPTDRSILTPIANHKIIEENIESGRSKGDESTSQIGRAGTVQKEELDEKDEEKA